MNRCLFRMFWGLVITFGVISRPAHAYPPAPFHLVYGMLRDQYGTPITIRGTEVVLETSAGVKVKVAINPGIEVGANYRLEVPMDAGLLAAPYQPTALRPFVPFRIKVRVGTATYLPIEMTGDYSKLGQPGQRTRIDLTLGEDSDGDGLPDAWERLINPDITQVKPDAQAANGLTYQQTYYAGTYVIDPSRGFDLSITGLKRGAAVLEFLAITGRTYNLVGSVDLKTWKPVQFRISTDAAGGPVRSSLLAESVKNVQIEAVAEGVEPAPSFFRLMLR